MTTSTTRIRREWEEVEERLRGILEEKLAQLRARRGKPPREQESDQPAEPKPEAKPEEPEFRERLKRTESGV